MNYMTLLMLFILLSASPVLQAQDIRYRVELLVLMHLDHGEPPERADWLADYSAAVDLLAPEEEPPPPCPDPEALTAGDLAEEVTVAGAPAEDAAASPGDTSTAQDAMPDDLPEEPPPDPNALFRVEEMGPEMQDAWRRLRLSAGFRPLQYLSWEQGSQPPFPEIRVHGEEVAYVDDPYAELRAAALEAELESELQQEQQAETEGPQIGDDDPVCEEPEADPFPEPTVHFALDGSASLVRSRFLHLQLDMQMREPVFETEAPAGEAAPPSLPATFVDGADTGLLPPRPAGFELHGLDQRRQVRSGRMEYFDSPVIGVLAWITPIELEDAPER